MDKIVQKIAMFGVPALVLIIVIGATGLTGAAALTTALASLGPFGMIGGIIILAIIGLVSDAITKYGIEVIFNGVVKELYKRGETKNSIVNKIEKYPISKDLKLKVYDKLNKISEE